jgi:hypothetical protein
MNILALLFYLLLGQYMPYPGAVASHGVSSTSWITSVTAGTVRNNFTGCIGMSLTVGASNITVTDVGRWVIAGDSNTHSIVLQNGTGVILSGTVNTSGAPTGAFVYSSITPTVLNAGGIYNLFSIETNGGDNWYHDVDSSETFTSDVTVGISAVSVNTPNCNGQFGVTAGHAFVPPNFKYHL